MDSLLGIVGIQASLTKIDAEKLGVFASKVPTWDYDKITKSEYKNFSKEDKSRRASRGV